jgi:hypothetical protein
MGESPPSQPSVSSIGVDSLRARRRPCPTRQISQVIDGRAIRAASVTWATADELTPAMRERAVRDKQES